MDEAAASSASAWLWQGALLLLLLGAAAWWLFGARLGGAARRRGAADALLLVGLNNAGKTCLFFRLCVMGSAHDPALAYSPTNPFSARASRACASRYAGWRTRSRTR